MAMDQLCYIRGIHGVTVNTVEIHEKDFRDKVRFFFLILKIISRNISQFPVDFFF